MGLMEVRCIFSATFCLVSLPFLYLSCLLWIPCCMLLLAAQPFHITVFYHHVWRTRFNKVETILTTALTAIGDYYIRNQLRANPDKNQTCAFHLRNREAKTELKVSWDGKKLEHTPTPVYLGVILDRTLSYSSHVAKVKAKTEARNNVLKNCPTPSGVPVLPPLRQQL